MIATFNCGHPRTAENTRIAGGRSLCRTCQSKYQREYKRKLRDSQTPADRFLQHRLEYLPRQLESARHKVAMLENEARRYGMVELLESQR